MPKKKQGSAPAQAAHEELKVVSKPAESTNAGSELKRKPFTSAILQLLAEEPEWTRKAALALLVKAGDGDLRAFVTLREMVEGKPTRNKATTDEDARPKYEDIGIIEVRILELLQQSPELLARLDESRKGSN